MTIVHKMRLDCCSEELIATFKGEKHSSVNKVSAAESQRALALEMGLKPKEAITPQRVHRLKRMHWKVVGLQAVKGTANCSSRCGRARRVQVLRLHRAGGAGPPRSSSR